MHFPLIKALAVAISASVVAIGVALAPGPLGQAHHAGEPGPKTSLEADGLRFFGQLAAGNVKPDAALKERWTDDVSAVARSLGLSDRELAAQLQDGHSLAQIATSRGVPTSTPTTTLLRGVREDLDRAEHDRAMSPIAANAVLDALSTVLRIPAFSESCRVAHPDC